jgi:hypothetical protein
MKPGTFLIPQYAVETVKNKLAKLFLHLNDRAQELMAICVASKNKAKVKNKQQPNCMITAS